MTSGAGLGAGGAACARAVEDATFVRDIRTHCDEDGAECQEMLQNIRMIMNDATDKNGSLALLQ
jgi:hypothetical protein